MSDAERVRAMVVIVAALVAVALASALIVPAALFPPSPGACQSLYGDRAYCTQTVTVSAWCPWGTPCPPDTESIVVQGFTFHLFGYIERNGTPELLVTIGGPGALSYNVSVSSNPLGTSASWVSPDGLVFVAWPSPIPAGSPPPLPSTAVVCGVAATWAGG